MSDTRYLLELLGIRLPIIQAPMAGVSSPAMAAAVTGAGGLGSVAVGALKPSDARSMILEARERSGGALNVNLFCHRPAATRPEVEADWIERFRPLFEQLGASPPDRLTEIYRSVVEDEEMLAMVLEARPPVVSFHFGLPGAAAIRALRNAGIVLLASVTSPAEASQAAAAGVQVLVAQGWEAGGHRGAFDPDAPDDAIGTLALTRLLARTIDLPIVAAGGIMDGAGIAAALKLGASAAQLGTAFIATDESLADQAYRAALASDSGLHTTMTRAVSGRPARGLANGFTRLGSDIAPARIPDYPIAYDLGKALHAAAKRRGEFGFGAHWAGQGAPLARALPAARLVDLLALELQQAF
ncbi:NAD(P)H-dependent flavin oxidoreductase [Allosphingosinicella deserti]|uniref:NAD(P)H-dependent flavin oxidoreductase n=1 Tax=Allosphingosinicella deserti TaxID=2116704 RepID=UPI0018EDD49E|nr:nitronate monooxygenase [Sphingomonas deserti]